MTVPAPQHRVRRAAPRRRRSRVLRAALVVLLGVLAFLLGVAFARTLDERPKPGGTVTSVRTLEPLPQEAPERTVTITVTATQP